MQSNVSVHVDTTAHFLLSEYFYQVATSAIKILRIHLLGMSLHVNTTANTGLFLNVCNFQLKCWLCLLQFWSYAAMS